MAVATSFQDADVVAEDGPYSIGLTFAAADGDERVVAVAFVTSGLAANRAITALTIDGETGTRLGRAAGGDDGNGNGALLEIWRAPGTANTSGNVAITLDGACFGAAVALWNMSGADATLAAAAVEVITATPQDLSLNTVADGAVIAAHYSYEATTPGTDSWSGLTERFDNAGAFAIECFTGASLDVGAGSTPLAISVDNDSDDTFAGIAISFAPAGGGFQPAWTRNANTLIGGGP